MEKSQSGRPRTVAVVGTGMAGLTTAHLLHQDPERRYEVTLLEKVSWYLSFSLPMNDSARGIQRSVIRGWTDT